MGDEMCMKRALGADWLGNNSVINYSMKVIEPVLTGDVDVIEIKESAEKTYIQRLQSALKNTVWATGCGSVSHPFTRYINGEIER